MAIVPRGKGIAQKAQPDCCQAPTPLWLEEAVTAAVQAAAVSLVSFSFPSLVTGRDLNLGAAAGAFRAGDKCVKQLKCLPALKIEKKLKFYLQRSYIMFL